MPSSHLLSLTDLDLDLPLGASRPLLVDVSTTWCPPCRALTPVLERLARARAGSLDVRTVDADSSPLLAAKLGARAFPTLVLFVGGREVARRVGGMPERRLADYLDEALAATPPNGGDRAEVAANA
jgi:thioredoxin-like negative regulator of GroEL